MSLEEVLRASFPWCTDWPAELRELFAAYVETKQRQNVLDYDDLLLYWALAMREPEIATNLRDRFDHVFVDEYQDTNRLQASILLALKPSGRGLTVVGDDAQSIYAFRAATVRNILDFPAQFDPPAAIVTLERNYRSTQRSSLRQMPSSIGPLSASPKISGPIGFPANDPNSSPCATKLIRRAMWLSAY